MSYQDQPSEKIRNKLEKAVLKTFSEGDFHQANMRTIAKEAGVSFGTIYKYYTSKEGLLFSFIDSWLEGLIERIIDHLQGIENIKEKLRKIIWLQLDFYERNHEVAQIIFLSVPLKTWMADETFRQRRMMRIFLEVIEQGQAAGILRSEYKPHVILDFWHGAVGRALTMWLYRGRKEPLAPQTAHLFEMIWRAVSTGKEQ